MDMHSIFPLDLVIKNHKCVDYFYLEIWNNSGFQLTWLLYEESVTISLIILTRFVQFSKLMQYSMLNLG